MKTKKKNKFVPLVVLLIALAALLGIYRFITVRNARRETERRDELQANEQKQMIAEYDYTTVTHLSYTKKGGEKLSFSVEGGTWVLDSDRHFPLDITTVTKMAAAIAQIAVECEVDGGSDESVYGLDDPEYTITVSYSEGGEHTYKIGSYNSFNSSYYFSADGDYYMIASGLLPYFNYTLDELMLLDTNPSSEWSDVSYINSITVTRGGEERQIGISGREEFVSLFAALPYTDCADYYADADERDMYGLTGEKKITVNYKKVNTVTDSDGNSSKTYLDRDYTVIFGNENEGGKVFFSPSGSNIVYFASADAVESLLAFTETSAETAESES